MARIQYNIDDRPDSRKAFPLAFQHVLSAFTGQISVVMVLAAGFGLDVRATSILMQCSFLIVGVTTILQSYGLGKYIGGRLPIVSMGSFTTVAPMVVAASNPDIGIAGAFGSACVGSLFLLFFGPMVIKLLYRYFRPAVTGSIILAVGVCIGSSAFYNFNPNSETAMVEYGIAIFVIITILLLYFFGKGLLKQCCILLGMVVGYIVMAVMGFVDFSPIADAAWFAAAKPFAFGFQVNWGVVLTIAIVHIGTIMEMTGDISGLTTAAQNRLPTEEELTRSVRAGGLGSCFAAAFNGSPVITGSANVGIVSMTGVASRYVTGLAGIIVIVFAFVPKFAQLLSLMPSAVMAGGIIVMCGQIAASGLRVISMDKFDDRNMMIIAISLGLGLCGNFGLANLSFLPATFTSIFTGIPGTALIGLLLNIILPKSKETDETAEAPPAAEPAQAAKAAEPVESVTEQ